MSIQNRRQLENTRKKLLMLEERYQTLEAKVEPESKTPTPARELTLRSLKKLINQMKEEIARFESRVSSSTERG
jgi:flagellar biosynthesis chaperone FliJ